MDRQSFEALLSAGEFEAPERPTALDTITATDLQKKDLPPIRFIVDRLLSVGLNILASPPKYGKSWMVLALCLAVASGVHNKSMRVPVSSPGGQPAPPKDPHE